MLTHEGFFSTEVTMALLARRASLPLVAMTVLLGLLLSLGGAQATRWHQLEGYTPDHYIQEFGRHYR